MSPFQVPQLVFDWSPAYPKAYINLFPEEFPGEPLSTLGISILMEGGECCC